MKSRQRVVILVVLNILILTGGVFGQERKGYGKPLASYKSPAGFTIKSYSKQWNTPAKLLDINNELLSNTFGAEISFLDSIYIYPDSPEGVLAYTHYDLARNYQGNYSYQDNAYIEIFDGNQYKNIEDMAWVLSHEYGHHFTIYHLVNKENIFFDQWPSTGYAKVRNITNNKKISYALDPIGNLYKWDIMEMAGEDYVQLFGSPNARKSVIYKDIQDRIQGNIGNHFNYQQAFNMKPQDNLEIPLAADVKGLESYWRNLANLPSVGGDEIPVKPRLRLVMKKEIAPGYNQYRIEWDKIPGDKKYEYTLVAYPDGQYAFGHPIKTVRPNEATYAIVGNGFKVDPKTGRKTLVVDNYTGRYTFHLYIKDHKNKIYRSDPLKVNFNYPVIESGIYKDIHPSEWSYNSIRQLYGRKVMVGSPDGYFYPLKGATYSELMMVLGRLSKESINWQGLSKEKREDLNEKQAITRDDMALLVYHYIQSKDLYFQEKNEAVAFKDVSDIYNKAEVAYLQKRGMIGGSSGYYYPKNNLTREEMAAIITRLLTY